MITKYMLALAVSTLATAPVAAALTKEAANLSHSKRVRAEAALPARIKLVGGGTLIVGSFAAAALFVIYYTLIERSSVVDAADSN